MRFHSFPFATLILALAAGGCVPKIEAPTPDPGRANFSKVVVLGGSELSGYQDGALYREGQRKAVGALIANQLSKAGGGAFSQNVMPGNSSMGLNKPWESRFLQASRLGDRTDCNGVVSLGPVRDTVSEADLMADGVWAMAYDGMQDLAIPFAGLWDLNEVGLGSDRSLDGPHAFAARYAFGSQGKSAVDAAVEQNPSFFVMWPGMADVYNWARQGGHGINLASATDFRLMLDSTLHRLTANGAKGVLATIPDIGHFPYFTTIPPRGLTLSQNKADSLNDIYSLVGASVNFQEGENGFIVGDPASALGFRQLEADEYITLSVPLDSMKCSFMGVLFTLMPDRYTLIHTELDQLRTLVDQYNAAITDLASAYDLAVADMASFYSDLKTGVRFDAVDFDAEFVSGGFFSLDGWHAHPKGAGMLANEYIAAINAKYGATVPPVQLAALRGVLFP